MKKREIVYGILMLLCFIALVIFASAFDTVLLNNGIIK